MTRKAHLLLKRTQLLAAQALRRHKSSSFGEGLRMVRPLSGQNPCFSNDRNVSLAKYAAMPYLSSIELRPNDLASPQTARRLTTFSKTRTNRLRSRAAIHRRT
jgi:hypothetical protein